MESQTTHIQLESESFKAFLRTLSRHLNNQNNQDLEELSLWNKQFWDKIKQTEERRHEKQESKIQ